MVPPVPRRCHGPGIARGLGVGARAGGYPGAVRHRSRISNLPARAAAGAFILSSGLGKLQADKDTHTQLHGFASGTYPFLENVPPEQFGKALGAVEVTLGSALLAPVVVSDGLAGFALTAFAFGLLGLYAKTPGMRREGSVRPTREGTALAKDAWLAGIGLTLMASSKASRRAARRGQAAKKRAVRAKTSGFAAG